MSILNEKVVEVEKNALDETVKTLPEIQQDIVKMCILTSKVHINKRKYPISLIYKCLLLRKNTNNLKNASEKEVCYRYHVSKLINYIEKLDCGAGFCKPVFRCLGKIAGIMEINAIMKIEADTDDNVKFDVIKNNNDTCYLNNEEYFLWAKIIEDHKDSSETVEYYPTIKGKKDLLEFNNKTKTN